MDAYLQTLVDKRQTAWAAAKAIMDTAAAENRDLTAEETASLEKTDADLDRYLVEQTRVVNMTKRLEDGDAIIEQIQKASAESRAVATPDKGTQEWRSLVAVMKGEQNHLDTARTMPVGFESRALATTSGTFYPTTVADFVTVYERTLNPMMDVATVINTNSGSPLVLPRLTADVMAGGSVTAEAAAKTEGDPTISTVQLGAFKIAHITLWSQELDDDEVIGLRQLLADAISRPIGLGWGTFFTTGTGTVQPSGFLTTATNGGTANGTASGGQASDTFFSAFDLIDLFYNLAAPYRRSASWMVSNTALAKMHKFRDANGELLWAPGTIAGAPDTFLGRPVYENPAMA
ncbi:MAG TPA: phage major capsid protein, partial [Candidatus Limnocylindrales bacterium]